jgi:hypothetical protein
MGVGAAFELRVKMYIIRTNVIFTSVVLLLSKYPVGNDASSLTPHANEPSRFVDAAVRTADLAGTAWR